MIERKIERKNVSDPTAEFRKAVWADLDRVAPLVLEGAAYLEERGVSGMPLFTAQLAIEEVVTNVIRHGGDPDSSRQILLRVGLSVDEIHVVVEDDGRPFDPSKDAPVPDTAAPLEERRPGGLGVHLVKELVHRLDYEREGATNRLELGIARAG